MEELRNNEEMMEMVEVTDTDYEVEETGGGIFGKVLVGLAIGAGALGVYAFKNRDKIRAKREEKAAEKLRRAGFEVRRISDEFIEVDEIVEFEASEEPVEEKKD